MHSNSSKSGKPHILGVALVCEIAISLWQGPFQNNFSFTHYLLVPCYFILRCPFFLSFFFVIKVSVQTFASRYPNETVLTMLFDFANLACCFTRALSHVCALHAVIICLWP